ncbi:hypothetical protein H257_16148 [Aphanomyces astaci]|uniref:Uncharacterized protein n=1 Tax=Aphanomyces astaci TaxID=112090 RepID=W4FJJ8_APHAT|nr:hypothetical protein H257_16148 [Aphanomyces astaci]ETV67677.1 hypothetical protein H257_16148 [Aphanomyces astaci]|eukprot:XP_009842798.1 hypothetical protein H257_16148 [Aphanomyces astaci]
MSLPPATSRAALPFTQRLLGAENFDNSFFEYTSVILAGEDLTEMATNSYKVLLNDCKCIRLHQAEAVALPEGSPPLPPLTIDAHLQPLDGRGDELIKLEKTAISRSCALVYASLSPTVQRDAAAEIRDECAHCIISSLRWKFSSDEQ